MTNTSNHLTDAILVEPFEENLADDPYGTAIFTCRNVIHRAIHNYGGTMSEGEHQNLLSIEELTRMLDNA